MFNLALKFDASINAERFTSAAAPVMRHQQRLVHILEQVGWEIRELNIDAHANHVVARLHRTDGRWLYVDCTGRTSVVERWHRRNIQGRTQERKPMPVGVLQDEFLGRIKCEGFRSALREMCNYIALNPSPGFAALSTSELRKALGPII